MESHVASKDAKIAAKVVQVGGLEGALDKRKNGHFRCHRLSVKRAHSSGQLKQLVPVPSPLSIQLNLNFKSSVRLSCRTRRR